MKLMDDEDDQLLGRLIAEYSEQINGLRAALVWISEHSSDPRACERALRELSGRSHEMPPLWR